LSANIKLVWKGLPGTNALAYFEKSLVPGVIMIRLIRLITQSHTHTNTHTHNPRASAVKLFFTFKALLWSPIN
jgi:hypothetical protein